MRIEATYRLQHRAGLGLDDAARLVPYLRELGVSHIYCSPYLQAKRGSTHGYDVVDHGRVNEELGGAAAHSRLIDALARNGMGHILDVVPNHMAIGARENEWWWDVLENGPSSAYASYFDVDWDPPERRLRNVILAPILGDHYGRVLEAGDIVLAREEEGRLVLRYHDHTFPLAPRSYPIVLARAAERAGSAELARIAVALDALPLATETDRESVSRRHEDKERLRVELARLCQDDREVARAIDETIAETNASPDALDALHARQNYRLAHWKMAGEALDYRRFFDVSSLAALRIEDERVFDATHRLVLGWLREGVLDAVRIDHVDGLRDPERYLDRLRAKAAADRWVYVEKILASEERLPSSWPVHGTTGYDFMRVVNGLFVDEAGEAALGELYTEITGQEASFADESYQAKREILDQILGAEVHRLGALFVRVCERHRRHRDYTRGQLEEVVREVAACFPVYRTYVRETDSAPREEDVRVIRLACARARTRSPEIAPDLIDFFEHILALDLRGELETELVMRFQQLTPPAMAKGVEDTAFYRYVRLASLNEVGGEPQSFGTSVEAFHAWCEDAQAARPYGMLATATHDTKRGEDTRVRISLLSQIPDRWATEVREWSELSSTHRVRGWPDGATEYLLWQTLVGAWPIEEDRVAAYMEKACREAKRHTSWTRPNRSYERAVREFVAGVMRDRVLCARIAAFVASIADAAYVSSLAQLVLKLTAPGVPDTYQGTELWDRSLVDPDNRRPVDYGLRQRLIAETRDMSPRAAWDRREEGVPKLWTMRRVLGVRRRAPAAFGSGTGGAYRPLATRGTNAHRVVAFARGREVAVVVPRLLLGAGEDWQDTAVELEGEDYWNELGARAVPAGDAYVRDLFGAFPVAVLVRGDARGDGS